MSGLSRYIIGIDLGTTNSCVAYVDTETGPEIRIFNIPQLTGEGQVNDHPALPSFLYLPTEYERASCALPWSEDIAWIVGEHARAKGALSPLNLVTSAKSWLCHSRVGRRSPILPWGRQDSDGGKVSPVEASSRYLRHIKEAWDYVMGRGDSKLRLEHQDVVITIPASFDESARELTSEAAKMAGIKTFTMLEEPQAAFYCWLSANEDSWHKHIKLDQLILVFDVGGGTTDFNLITLKEVGGVPVFQRMAVGDHLMLGGDNMDLALAVEMERRISGSGNKRALAIAGWVSLSEQCRAAKEWLLSDTQPPAAVDISILGAGRSVIGGAVKGRLTYDDLRRVILDGFFAETDTAETKDKRTGLQELGLPYETDTAVMRHLASFLRRHAGNPDLPVVSVGGVEMVRPDIVLFNGGVFKPRLIRQCILDCLTHWYGGGSDWSLSVLENDRFDHAVSLGAAYYGAVKREAAAVADGVELHSSLKEATSKKIRISGGLGKAYYIAVETGRKAAEGTISAACIVPRGFEEGGEIHIAAPEFHVAANTPVAFSVYCSSYRAGDRPGDIITAQRDSFVELPRIKTVLHYGKKAAAAAIAVSLGIRLNEYGTLDVWCESKSTTHKWRLAFDIRKAPEVATLRDFHTLNESNIDDAVKLIETAFAGNAADINPDGLPKGLSEALGIENKADWPLPAIRKMWDALISLRQKRHVTPRHEARWLNLAGFLLRPGFGHQLDSWRVKELWKLFAEGVRYGSVGQCRSEWWILWRRVAGGLNEHQQDIVYKRIAPFIIASRKKKGQRLATSETVELWMLASSLEHLSPEVKTAMGDELLPVIKKEKGRAQGSYFWSLSRLGARISFYGQLERQVTAGTAQRWIKESLSISPQRLEDAAYAIAQLARKTGDRTRDIDETLRAEIIKWLTAFTQGDSPARWAARFIKQVGQLTPLEFADETEQFGESLPIGLIVEDKAAVQAVDNTQ